MDFKVCYMNLYCKFVTFLKMPIRQAMKPSVIYEGNLTCDGEKGDTTFFKECKTRAQKQNVDIY